MISTRRAMSGVGCVWRCVLCMLATCAAHALPAVNETVHLKDVVIQKRHEFVFSAPVCRWDLFLLDPSHSSNVFFRLLSSAILNFCLIWCTST